jgi:hypothetical protein
MTVADQQMRAALMLVPQHFGRLGLDLPASFADDLDQIAGRFDGLTVLEHNPRRLTEAVADCIAAGTDPAADPDVVAELTRAQLAQLNVRTDLERAAAESRAATLNRHADTIVDALAAEVDRLDTILVDAHQQVPDLPAALTDNHRATSLPPDRLAAWGQARDAVTRLGQIVQAWTLLVRACHLAHVRPKTADLLLILADLDLEQLTHTVRTYGVDPTAPAVAGHRLTLATPEQYAQRLAAIGQEQAEARNAEEQRERQALRRAAGAFGPSAA